MLGLEDTEARKPPAVVKSLPTSRSSKNVNTDDRSPLVSPKLSSPALSAVQLSQQPLDPIPRFSDVVGSLNTLQVPLED